MKKTLGIMDKHFGPKSESSPKPDVLRCPKGHPTQMRNLTNYCSICDSFEIVDEWTGKPTGNWT